MHASLRVVQAVVLTLSLIGAGARYIPHVARALTIQGTVFAGTVVCSRVYDYSWTRTIGAQTQTYTETDHEMTSYTLSADGGLIQATSTYAVKLTQIVTNSDTGEGETQEHGTHGMADGSTGQKDDYVDTFDLGHAVDLPLGTQDVPATQMETYTKTLKGGVVTRTTAGPRQVEIRNMNNGAPPPLLTVTDGATHLSGTRTQKLYGPNDDGSSEEQLDGQAGCTWDLLIIAFNGKLISSATSDITPTDTSSPTKTPTSTPTKSPTATPAKTTTATQTPTATATQTCSQPPTKAARLASLTRAAPAVNSCPVSDQFLTPDVKVLAFIDQLQFNPDACINELKANAAIRNGIAGEAARGAKISRAANLLEQHFAKDWLLGMLTSLGTSVKQVPKEIVEACGGLSASANPLPPSPFTETNWQTYKASKEYRGYVHIPSLIVTVRNGRISGTPQLVEQPEHSYGFTKIAKVPFGPAESLDAADPYLPNRNPPNPFKGRPNFTMKQTGSTIVLRSWVAARLGRREQELNYKWFGYDAPFIYLDLTETVTFTGGHLKTTVRLARSEFPTASLYVNNQWKDSYPQANLVDFMLHGGNVLHKPGIGPLAPAGPSGSWQN